jgi:hypothetical protein
MRRFFRPTLRRPLPRRLLPMVDFLRRSLRSRPLKQLRENQF